MLSYSIQMTNSVITWMGGHQGRPGAVNNVSVRRCELDSMTDRLYSCYRADTEVK